MKNCAFYIEKAITNSGLKNHAELARLLKIKHPSLIALEKGKTTPADSTMLKLIELSGEPKEEAFINLNIWRSKNDPKRLSIWKNISKMIGFFIAFFLIPGVAHAAESIVDSSWSIHYVAFIKRLKKISHCFSIKKQKLAFY